MIRKIIDCLINMLRWSVILLITISTLVVLATGNNEIALLTLALIIVWWMVGLLQGKE